MAASILAKVARDRRMLELHALHPQYGFDRHKGYPSPVASGGTGRARALPAAPTELRAGAGAARG